MRRVIFRIVLPVVLLLVFLIGILALTYFSGTVGIFTPRIAQNTLNIPPTSVVPAPGTPIARFEQVSPAVINEFNQFQSGYSAQSSSAFGVDVQPLGAYLPRTGNRQFALQDPTPLPTIFPYPTSPPLPAPPIAGEPRTTLVPGDRTLPYDAGQGDCSPQGLPVDGLFTQRFHRYHLAVDIGVPRGTPVVATHSGIVVYADWSNIGYGYLVILQSGAFITYYAHNTSFNVEPGQAVGKGSIIAWSGNTGNSTGPHVHYETRLNDIPVDPLTFDNRGYYSC
ncbi:MAG: M23 family metallopeptidase [Chloroflexota bacterium]